jgi:hypothetical protein
MFLDYFIYCLFDIYYEKFVNELIHNEGAGEFLTHQLNMRVDEPLPLVEPNLTETVAILLFPPKRF